MRTGGALERRRHVGVPVRLATTRRVAERGVKKVRRVLSRTKRKEGNNVHEHLR